MCDLISIKHSAGYRSLRIPTHPRADSKGYVLEHIVVMEKKLGRPLQKREVVHHIDGNRSNNSPDNLELYVNNGEHISMHFKEIHKLRGIDDRICFVCSGKTPFNPRNNAYRWTRSRITGQWICNKCYMNEWRQKVT